MACDGVGLCFHFGRQYCLHAEVYGLNGGSISKWQLYKCLGPCYSQAPMGLTSWPILPDVGTSIFAVWPVKQNLHTRFINSTDSGCMCLFIALPAMDIFTKSPCEYGFSLPFSWLLEIIIIIIIHVLPFPILLCLWMVYYFAFVLFACFGSLNSCCSGTHSVEQAGLELRDPVAFASQGLGLKPCTTSTHQDYFWKRIHIWFMSWLKILTTIQAP